MTPQVAVVGSLNMDLVVRTDRLPLPGETIVGRDFRILPGGKGANQSWLPDRLVKGITEREFIDGSIRKTLIEVYHLLPTKGIEWVEPTNANSCESELLNIPEGTPLLLLTTISYLTDDTPVEFSKTLWRSDKLRLQINSRDFEITFR